MVADLSRFRERPRRGDLGEGIDITVVSSDIRRRRFDNGARRTFLGQHAGDNQRRFFAGGISLMA